MTSQQSQRSVAYILTRVITGAHTVYTSTRPQLVHHAHFVHMRFFQTTLTREATVRIPEKLDAKLGVNEFDVPLMTEFGSRIVYDWMVTLARCVGKLTGASHTVDLPRKLAQGKKGQLADLPSTVYWNRREGHTD